MKKQENMKNLDEVKVSVYPSVRSTKNTQETLMRVLALIKTGWVKDRVLAARRYYADGDLKAANAMKEGLQCFTPSGLFEGGHAVKNLIEATGYIILDFDEVDDLENLRAVCEGDPHTVSGFQSPLKGYKVIAHVENSAGRHREAYELVRAHYEEITGLPVDASGKDISRTCYFSYDPDCYIAALFDSFVLCNPCLKNSQQESFAGRESDFISANLLLHPLREGNRNSGTFTLGCKAAKAGCNLEAVYAEMSQHLCGNDFTGEELKRCLESAYQHVANEKEGQSAGSSKAPVSDKATKRHIGLSENAETAEEDFQDGEELRRNTPLIPEEVYENIPELLAECLDVDMDGRQRDVRLLACLTAFSALLPGTSGRYNHKRYTPHLFGWVIAPPASGKSAAEAAVHLLDETNRIIEGESDRLWDSYEEQLSRYNKFTPRKRKKATPEEEEPAPEKPQRPAYRSLVIPANISNSRLIEQLRDNGVLGGYLFDTEAETLAVSNKQDYGHLDTILCKVFELEPIGSSYYVHGQKPVSCRRPCMAMMLTGTTLQMDGLLSRPGTGLESRILFYTFGNDYRFLPAGEGGDESTDEHFERLSHRAYGLFCFCREHPMELKLTRSQWDELNCTFRELNDNAFLEDRNDLMSTVRRYAVCVMRMAMVLARLEQYATGNTAAKVVCPDTCFHTALSIVLCCYRHCRLLFTSFSNRRGKALQNPDNNSFPLDILPHRFTHAEAVKVGESHGFGKRRTERILKRMEGLKIKWLSRGNYEKLK